MKTAFFLLLCAISWLTSMAQPLEYSFVFLNKKVKTDSLAKEEVNKLMEGHMANITRLAKEGKLVAAGPFEGGGGIFVFKTPTLDSVKKWIQTDPAVKANRWNVEMFPYLPLVSGICKAEEPYQMVTYYFLRFWPDIKKFNVRDTPALIAKHEDYWKKQKPDLITFASFLDNNGDIIVSGNEFSEAIINNDPAIQAGLLRVEKKKLWIAKGSFCEK